MPRTKSPCVMKRRQGAQTAADQSLPSGAMIVLLGIVVAVAAILGIGFALTRKKA